MKTKILLIALVALAISSCQAQSGTTVYAKNSDISDNLDLRAVASMFGESSNLQDFERRLNDPKYQISNLDLNGDDEVDYLRVIESVEDRTHVVIIQAVLDRDVFQDVATIDVERDNYNKVNVQVVGNTYLYGANYIYEPVYNVVPVIYTSFWVNNYRPYYSSWSWNYYPTYYTAWTPYPMYRYRNNINVCINVNNHYNYVNTRRSYRAPAIYQTRRSYGYETMRPNNSFAQRHANVNNRYDLDQRRVAARETNRNSYNNGSNTNRSTTGRVSNVGGQNRNTNRNYADYRTGTDKSYNTNRNASENTNSARTNNPLRVDNAPRTESRNYANNPARTNSDNTTNTNRTASTPRTETQRQSSENRVSNNTPVSTPRVQAPRENSKNRMSNRSASPQRSEAPRNYSENRSSAQNNQNTARQQQSPQRTESPRASQESRSSQPQRESGSASRGGNGGGRRG